MKPRKSFLIRIDPWLHEELVAWAQQEFRSVNGQIEFLLRQAVMQRRNRRDEKGNRQQPTDDRDDE